MVESSASHSYFATCPRGVEAVLAMELRELGAGEVVERRGGVAFAGPLPVAYRACLWSRTASRILRPLVVCPLTTAEAGAQELYAGAAAVDWPALFEVTQRFAIEVAGRSAALPHTHFAGLRVKDAIVDTFRERTGMRPDVDTESPDVRVHLHLDAGQATLSLDLAGDSLHRRGYRGGHGEAPLKENLAAAILLLAGWPHLARNGRPFCDPMCGSGTLAIEAALIAADCAPGLRRSRWGFQALRDFDASAWQALKREAQARFDAGRGQLPPIFASDSDGAVLRNAQRNAANAGLASAIRFGEADVLQLTAPAPTPGLIAVNPPYGERLGSESDVIKLFSLLGGALKNHFPGWSVALFTSRPDLSLRLGLRAHAQHALFNGPLACKLLQIDIKSEQASEAAAMPSAGGEDFANRLRKNIRHLGKWARRNQIANYRLYDADLPEYAVAVDVYEAEDGRHLHVQEYAPPDTIEPARAERRLREALTQIQNVLAVPAARLHYKLRRAQRGSAQYQRQDERQQFHTIVEHGCRLRVNFDDYLDTGVFLDHRPMRLRLQREAAGKRVLNLFCYTAAATVHMVVGGARSSLSIDLSNTYLEWAALNLALNDVSADLQTRGLDAPPDARHPHRLLRADVLAWLRAQVGARVGPQFDLIFCDPPTFSNSKKMDGVLDTQADHVELIRSCHALLAPGGVLYFSTNRRRFRLDADALTDLSIAEITPQTLDEDFKRPPPAHRCWRIEKAAQNSAASPWPDRSALPSTAR